MPEAVVERILPKLRGEFGVLLSVTEQQGKPLRFLFIFAATPAKGTG